MKPFDKPAPQDWTPVKNERVYIRPGLRLPYKGYVQTVADKFVSVRPDGHQASVPLGLDDVRPVYGKET